MSKKPIIIVAPTASGKTDVAIALAKKINGEIISVDSRQVYKYLEKGTAKPEGKWQDGKYLVDDVPYHLVDILEPTEPFDASKFVAMASKISLEILQRKKTPIFAGGTGMYIQAYFVGMDNMPKSNPKIRAKLQAEAEKFGKDYLHKKLAKIDRISASQIPPQNIQRVMRALEIYQISGKKPSSLKTGAFFEDIPSKKATILYLNWDKEELEKRIILRTNQIFEPMVKEAKALIEKGFAKDCPALKSLGYKEAIEFLDGKLSKKQAIEKIVILTRQYAKRQRTWFARYKNAEKISINSQKDLENINIVQ